MKVRLTEAGVLPEGWAIEVEPVTEYRPSRSALYVRLIGPDGEVTSIAGMELRKTTKPLSLRTPDHPDADPTTYTIGPFWTGD